MKHLFRAVFLAVFCLWSAAGAFAASATIDRIWLEHNVSQDGQTGLRIHLKFTVWDMQGQQGEAVAYFESPKGVGVKDLNRRYYTTDGNVCTSERFTPSYPGSEYSDFTLFIPNEELHLLPGSHTYYCQVFLFDAQGNHIAYSDYASTFTLRRDLTAATYHGGGSLSPLESYGPPMSRDSWMEASIAWGKPTSMPIKPSPAVRRPTSRTPSTTKTPKVPPVDLPLPPTATTSSTLPTIRAKTSASGATSVRNGDSPTSTAASVPTDGKRPLPAGRDLPGTAVGTSFLPTNIKERDGAFAPSL